MDDVKKLAYSVDEASKACGVSRTTMMQMIKLPDFPVMHVGSGPRGRWLIPCESLEEWLKQQTKEKRCFEST